MRSRPRREEGATPGRRWSGERDVLELLMLDAEAVAVIGERDVEGILQRMRRQRDGKHHARYDADAGASQRGAADGPASCLRVARAVQDSLEPVSFDGMPGGSPALNRAGARSDVERRGRRSAGPVGRHVRSRRAPVMRGDHLEGVERRYGRHRGRRRDGDVGGRDAACGAVGIWPRPRLSVAESSQEQSGGQRDERHGAHGATSRALKTRDPHVAGL